MGFLEVTTSDGRMSLIELEKAEMKLGRATSADIVLDKEAELEAEHVLLAARKTACWIAVVDGARVPLLIQGIAHTSGMVPWGTALTLGKVQLRLLERAPGTTAKKEGASPIVVLGSLGILVGAYFAFGRSANGVDLERHAPTEPVALFPSAAAACPVAGERQRTEAAMFGAQAFAKSERYPFDASDGVESVALFLRAGACFAGASDADSATRMNHEAEYMRARIEDDYRGHQFRLQRAMNQNRFPDALHEARALLALTGDFAEHAYHLWLLRTERQLLLAIPTTPERRRR